MQDVWFIRDDFLKESYAAWEGNVRMARSKNKDLPYLEAMYNVKENHAKTQTVGLARIINPLVELLNEHHKLPRMLVIIPDKDLLTRLQDRTFASAKVMGAALHYIIKQIDLMINCRKSDLMLKKPGALKNMEDSPKLIWVGMLKRPKSDFSKS